MRTSDLLTDTFRLVETQQKALRKLGITTVGDLLLHAPSRYENIEDVKTITSLAPGDEAVVYGRFSGLTTRKTWRSRRAIAEGWLEDGTGRIKVMWFNQPYLAKMVVEGQPMKVTGAVGGKDGKVYLANPEVEPASDIPVSEKDSLFTDTGDEQTLFAIYPEAKGISSKWFRHAIERVFTSGILDTLDDPIPNEILARYKLPALREALIYLHAPKRMRDAEAARKRFAFQEVFLIQLGKMQDRFEHDHAGSLVITPVRELIQEFTNRFPFALTKAQRDALSVILSDLKSPGAMARLVEGDVGSGKTAVAATVIHAVTQTPPSDNAFGRLQTAYMCPTEILAKQHFASFIEYFHHTGISIGLITSSGCKKYPSKVDPTAPTDVSRAQLLKWVTEGDIPILIGTHALIQKSVSFRNLGLVIIDEQHRFGTMQRHALTRKDSVQPHLLSMTATPIPRTLALTIFGDLDLTVIDQMPKGRKPIITTVVKEGQTSDMYHAVRTELQAGRQAYVICPRIDEPDPEKEMAVQATSAVEEAKRLQKEVFPEYRVGLVHSKLKPAEKESVMDAFARHELDILVATSVVEVGVNVPNATVIVIEGAERFGLAQLHQLRGRVIRSNHQAYCFAVSGAKSKRALDRLRALTTAKNGFELAEYDLKLRGAGELYGRAQSGLSDLGMEALKNLKLVEAARTEARALIEREPTLSHHPDLAALVLKKREVLHGE